MTYLLIIVIVALIISPLVWLKPSLRQQQLEQLRREARHGGLRVRLSTRPDVREGEKAHFDCACYCLPWDELNGRPSGRMGAWTLVRDTRRGITSGWDDWRWLAQPAPEEAGAAIEEITRSLPKEALGLVAALDGLEFYWTEKPVQQSNEEVVALLIASLQSLVKSLSVSVGSAKKYSV